jgi:hypothetical protein
MRLNLRLAAALAATLLLAAPTMAQTVSSADADAPIASASAKALDAQISTFLNAEPESLPPARAASAGGPADGPPDRAVHGEAGVSIGSSGYRQAYASMIAPVGSTGTVAMAVGDTRWTGRGGAHSRQSLSIGASLGDGSTPGGQAAACAGLHDAGGPEPLWAMRLRAERPAANVSCPSDRLRP